MFSDFPIIFSWWLLLFLLGIFCLPTVCSLFSKFWDKGYSFAKIIGILFVSYLVWLLGSLKLIPFTRASVWGMVIFLGAINLVFFKNQKSKIKNQKYWKIWLSEEILFFLCLLFWSYIRGFQPNIHGLEKYMDYGFVNSILRSRYFPPLDMWMAGKTINYYYFGHLVAAVLTKFSGLDSAVTYNLMMATIFALCFTVAFSLTSNLIYLVIRNLKFVILGGTLSAFLLSLGGNLQHLWYFLRNRTFSGYWYPDATRFIIQKFGAVDNTIHEFPIYSFVVADLHGHFLDLPFVLLFLALVLVIFTQKQVSLFLCFFVSLFLGVMSMTNFWDLPIYLLVLGIVLLWKNWKTYGLNSKTLFKTALSAICYLLSAILFSLPFHLNFKSIAKGISFVDFRSPIWMLFFLWGFPLFITISFLGTVKARKRAKTQKLTDCFVLILLLISWLLILIPEVLYVKDIYIHSYQRANTVFKLTYQSFIMFSLSSGYIIVRVLAYLKKGLAKNLLFTFYFLLFTFVMIYPYFAIKSYYGLKKYQGLDGIEYLKALYPDDYQAILWLRKEIPGQPVILEAVGDSYTDFARVSANTGLPTVVGWPVHEWLWRGSYDEVGKRKEEVRKIYELEGLEETKKILRDYEVDYVFLGALEKKEYKNLNEEKLNSLGKVVFQQGETRVYKIEIRD